MLGGTLVVGSENLVRAWDWALREETLLLPAHEQCPVTTVRLSEDGKLILSGNRYGSIRAFDTKTGLSAAVFGHGCHRVLSLALSGDGTSLYGGGEDGAVLEWCVATGNCRRVLRGHQGQVLGVWTGNEDVFSCGQDGTIRVWEHGPSTRCKKVLKGHSGGVLSLCSTRGQRTLMS
mmetsp:Transcript_36608/g.92056  ORF Transcript_36608/g.92056 Transcript_36608/m.92056 type:complete len:176 (+) Transcript_36608:1850-2377(+)